MAVDLKQLISSGLFSPKPVAGTGSVQVFFYASNDTKAAIVASGYFNAAADLLPVGTPILVSFDLDGTPGNVWVSVDGNDGSTVTVAETDNVTFASQMQMDFDFTATDGTYWLGVFARAVDIDAIYTVARGQVTTNNAVCTFRINTTAITDGVVTIAAGGAAGDVDSATPSAANSATAGQALSVVVSNSPASGINIRGSALLSAA